MPRPIDNRAWLLVAPALVVLGVVGALPLLAVVNYGLHDIFTLSDVHWVGVQWFADILGSERFLASLGR
ncbi:MAG: sugar ABC transporter permease, partial [Rhodobacteraceae bacterium]|nr:sugar ABC transporter permease [Paracoccaceae bacterium]